MRLAATSAAAWAPDEAQFAAATALLDEAEQARALRFRQPVDRRRAVLGRLLTRARVAPAAPRALELRRTAQGKPFAPGAAGGSFNLSHHGDWVVCATHPAADVAVGVDVMRYEHPRGCTAPEFFHTMRHTLTAGEWALVRAGGADEWEQLRRFYRLWTLKESYIKAVGVGLGMELQRMEFAFDAGPRGWGGDAAALSVDGRALPHWRFASAELDELHVVTVALGPRAECLPPDAERRAEPPPPAAAENAVELGEAPELLAVEVVGGEELVGLVSGVSADGGGGGGGGGGAAGECRGELVELAEAPELPAV